MECEYCNQTFKTRGNLNKHLKNAKYCLELRNQENEKWTCKYCEKELSSKDSLRLHYDKCKYRNIELSNELENLKRENLSYIEKLKDKDEQIQEYRNTIKSLQSQINELASKAIDKPTTINNNNNNNQSIKNINNRTVNMIPWNLIPDQFQRTLEEKFSERHFLNGQKGVAEFMLENILIQGEKEEEKKYLMKCTDPARKTFITLDQEGKVVKDINAENLTRFISDPVKEKCQAIYKNIHNDYLQTYENVGNELEEGDPDQERLEYIGAKFEHATDKVVEIARLKNNNTDFIKTLIPGLSV